MNRNAPPKSDSGNRGNEQSRGRSSDMRPANARASTLSPAPYPLRPATFLVLAATVFITGLAFAQVQQPPGTFPHRHGAPPANQVAPRPGAKSPQATMPAPTPTGSGLPHSLLDQPAQPAEIEISEGQLTIHADNSSLTAILHQISASGGTAVDGLNKDERVFGTYGPGEPREILSSLLDGSGYNVVMFGKTAAGTPSQISLTPRGAALPAGAAAIHAPAKPEPEEEEEDPLPTQYQDNPPPNPAPGTAPNGPVRTAPEMMQQLQQQRQQQMQQQQQQQQVPPPPPQ
jgi:hypothetical protein